MVSPKPYLTVLSEDIFEKRKVRLMLEISGPERVEGSAGAPYHAIHYFVSLLRGQLTT